MSVYIHHIEPFVPDNWYSQNSIRDFMIEHIPGKEITRKLLHRIYAFSGIEKRHSVIKDFNPEQKEHTFLEKIDGKTVMPGTAHRNKLYSDESKVMYPEIARRTLNAAKGFSTSEITHVITVSCTGFFAPGPDYQIVKELELPPTTERYHIGFMGCYAAFPDREWPNIFVMLITMPMC